MESLSPTPPAELISAPTPSEEKPRSIHCACPPAPNALAAWTKEVAELVSMLPSKTECSPCPRLLKNNSHALIRLRSNLPVGPQAAIVQPFPLGSRRNLYGETRS